MHHNFAARTEMIELIGTGDLPRTFPAHTAEGLLDHLQSGCRHRVAGTFGETIANDTPRSPSPHEACGSEYFEMVGDKGQHETPSAAAADADTHGLALPMPLRIEIRMVSPDEPRED